MPQLKKTYPLPGSHSDRILRHIQQNPGVTTSGVHRGLGLNPSPARTYLRNLLDKGLIEDRPVGTVHHYYARTPAL